MKPTNQYQQLNQHDESPQTNTLSQPTTCMEHQLNESVSSAMSLDSNQWTNDKHTSSRRIKDSWYEISSSDTAQDDLTFRYASFPTKLHKALDDAHTTGLDHILSWHADGKRFRVYDTNAFGTFVMPRYFGGQSKYKSFQRQLNLYGFLKESDGTFKGYYGHELFRRGNVKLSSEMNIQKVKRKSPTKTSPRALERRAADTIVLVKTTGASQTGASDDVFVDSNERILDNHSQKRQCPGRPPKRSRSDELSLFAGRRFYSVEEKFLRAALL